MQSARVPAYPHSTFPSLSSLIFTAVFLNTVAPYEICPSPIMTTCFSLRTARMVVPWYAVENPRARYTRLLPANRHNICGLKYFSIKSNIRRSPDATAGDAPLRRRAARRAQVPRAQCTRNAEEPQLRSPIAACGGDSDGSLSERESVPDVDPALTALEEAVDAELADGRLNFHFN